MINKDLFPPGSDRPFVPLTEAEHIERDNHIRRLEHDLKVARRDLKVARRDLKVARDVADSLAARVAAQAELLARRAERGGNG